MAGAATWLLPLLAADSSVVAAVPPLWRAELLLLLTARPSLATAPARAHLVAVLQATAAAAAGDTAMKKLRIVR